LFGFIPHCSGARFFFVANGQNQNSAERIMTAPLGDDATNAQVDSLGKFF
jgi:hypothetical protein